MSDVSCGIFTDNELFEKFCCARPSLLIALLKTFACGEDRFTDYDFETVVRRLEDPGVLSLLGKCDATLLPDQYLQFWFHVLSSMVDAVDEVIDIKTVLAKFGAEHTCYQGPLV